VNVVPLHLVAVKVTPERDIDLIASDAAAPPKVANE